MGDTPRVQGRVPNGPPKPLPEATGELQYLINDDHHDSQVVISGIAASANRVLQNVESHFYIDYTYCA